MKIITVLIAGSLAANVALLGLVVLSPSDDPSAAARFRAATAAAKTAAKSDAASAETWADLQSDDLTVQRDRLQAAGYPPEIVRAILSAQINESFSARRKAIENAQGEMPFWKNPVRDPQTLAAMRDLSREQQKVLKDLLGNDGRYDDPAYAAYLNRQFGNLPADKIDRLRLIQEDYNQKRSDLIGAGGGMVPEDRQKMADLEKAMHAEFASILSPEEMLDYDLRSSSTAQQLRYNLAAFDATEQEYRAIFALQQSFDEKYRFLGPTTPEESRARMEAQKQLTADIKAALGPDRGTDYERAIDYSYRQASQLVARLELPAENAVGLWNTQKEFEKRRTDIFSSMSTLPPAERQSAMANMTAQLTALQQEAVAKVTPLLGGDASRVEVYKTNGGQWLQNLVPRPAPSTAASRMIIRE